tara:strand:- start:1070 stop:2011 length:942 start_codon:yes stop_codon:yes gene_type:complete
MYSLVEMLRYKRPEGSQTQRDFCKRFLEPHFGMPDTHGNYVLVLGDEPRLCFTAHHDTVHKTEGMQKLVVTNNVVSIADSTVSSCLGADCTTGIWLMINMIEAGINATYVVHAGEEIGCVGSSNLVKDDPAWLRHTDAVISFDRYGDKSIITHQMGMRTASDEFAKSFSMALDMPQLRADNTGSYTDSNEYAYLISECTNISVGYYGQHGVNETQDLDYADLLSERLLNADWNTIIIARDTSLIEDLYHEEKYAYKPYDKHELDDMRMLLEDHPEAIAKLLLEYGFSKDVMLEEAHIQYDDYFWDNYASKRYM